MEPLIRIARATALPARIEVLCAEAEGEGFQFMNRLLNDWKTGSNRFDQSHECFLVACFGEELAGVGGLNQDRYVGAGTTGRIRHLFVRRSARRHGVGSALLRQLLATAQHGFEMVRLRTDTPEAAAFYIRHGFMIVDDETASHTMRQR